MRLRKLGAALFVAAALGAVLASSAFAAATTSDVKWYTGTAPGTELSGSETVSVSQVEVGKLTTHVGKEVLELQWKSTECVECSIKNTTTEGAVLSSGKLKFTGVTVAKPSGCAVSGGTITSNPVGGNPGWMSGTTDYIRIRPVFPGESEELFGANITGCPLEGLLNFKGNVFFHVFVSTGTQSLEQSWGTSEAINSEAGGSLHAGAEAAALALTLKVKLSGGKAGTAFGTH